MINIGMSGEFRVVLYGADGLIKEDTGYQKNLILDQGLDFFGGGKGDNVNHSCVIGTGNSEPDVAQTKLDEFVDMTTGTIEDSSYSYTDIGNGLYHMWEQKFYSFIITDVFYLGELGLSSQGTEGDYYLTTRALFKDEFGTPRKFKVRKDEILDIYYKFHKVIDVNEKNFIVNLLDDDESSIPHNIKIKPINVGIEEAYSLTEPLVFNANTVYSLSDGDLSDVTSEPVESEELPTSTITVPEYVPSEFKRLLQMDMALTEGNQKAIRTLFMKKDGTGDSALKFSPFQMRIGSVDGDEPLNKTDKYILSIPVEVRWGRHTGGLG